MNQYLNALRQVLEQGQEKTDRTGTGTISLFGMQQRYDLSHTFPAVTTKKLAWKSVVSELLWFIEGRPPSGLTMPQHLIGAIEQSLMAT